MYSSLVRWLEQRSADQDAHTKRRVPFEWGLEWLGGVAGDDPRLALLDYGAHWLRNAREFFATERADHDVRVDAHTGRITFASPTQGPCAENNTAHAELFSCTGSKGAVLLLPHWGADLSSYRWLAAQFRRLGLTAVLVVLPFHEARQPPGCLGSEYFLSANIGRTLHAWRQAVLEVRVLIDWLSRQGVRRFGLVGNSSGSCVAYLTSLFEPRVSAVALSLIGGDLAFGVWTGISTEPIRRHLEPVVTIAELRRMWAPVSPVAQLSNGVLPVCPSLIVLADHDLTVTRECSGELVRGLADTAYRPTIERIPCGHYTLSRLPFSVIWMARVTTFIRARLSTRAKRR